MAQSAATTLLFTALTAYVALAAPVDHRSVTSADDAMMTPVAAQVEPIAAIAALNAYFPSGASAHPPAVPTDIAVSLIPVDGTDGLVMPSVLYHYLLHANMEAILPGNVAITHIPVDGTDHGLVIPTVLYSALLDGSDIPVTWVPVDGTDGLAMPTALYYLLGTNLEGRMLPGDVAVTHIPVDGTDHGLVMPTDLYRALLDATHTDAGRPHVPIDMGALPDGQVDAAIANGGHYGAPVPGMPGVYTIITADGAVTCSTC